MISGWTLEEALLEGRGEERPFRCHVHDDSSASASVNVTKGVWYCFACFASGTVDGKKVPSVTDLQAMVEPEAACREYPETYLELFDSERSYWHGRFPPWLVWTARLGQDPFTGHATFPVRTPEGRLAGVGRRDPDPEAKPRYRYPPRWSAARVLHGENDPKTEIVVLVEGAADRESLTEIGVPALGCYGAGLHRPQVEALLRRAPRRVLLGFDQDEAGTRAVRNTEWLLAQHDVTTAVVEWPRNDPAECSPDERRQAVQAVAGRVYVPLWSEAVEAMQARYRRSVTTEEN